MKIYEMEAGFHTIAAVAEYSIDRRFAEGRPDELDREQLMEYVKKIREKIVEQNMEKPEIPGSYPYKERGGAGMAPAPDKECVNCGKCAEQCPVQAIDTVNPQKVDREACISCMRCVFVCPHFARKVNADVLTAVRQIKSHPGKLVSL